MISFTKSCNFFVVVGFFSILIGIVPTNSWASLCRETFQQDSTFDFNAVNFKFSEADLGIPTWKIEMKSKKGEEIGFIEYEILSEKRTLVPATSVVSRFQRKGAYYLMVKKLLEEKPQIKKVIVDLVDTNLAAYEAALSSTTKAVSEIDAVKATPFYKVYSKFGFTEIIKVEEHHSGHVSVELLKVEDTSL